jgi:hypothetical protein
MLDQQQIEKRKPLWLALSELWLDTELDEGDLQRISRIMVESALSIEELREIYLIEVAPIVSPNLLTVAGVWDGFDEEWLYSKILRNLQHRPRRTRFMAWFPITRHSMIYATERHWRNLVKLVQEQRG